MTIKISSTVTDPGFHERYRGDILIYPDGLVRQTRKTTGNLYIEPLMAPGQQDYTPSQYTSILTTVLAFQLNFGQHEIEVEGGPATWDEISRRG
jgi:hypothetical protein